MGNRILFGASRSVVEPLGLLHLAGLARDMGWERKISLVENHDFEHFFDIVEDFKPDIVGFNVYTGNHLQLFDAFKRLKKDYPNIQRIVGSPHPTYFPDESAEHADFIVMGEGFNPLRKILKGSAERGIVPSGEIEKFPHPDRETFYREHKEYAESPIKSLITMTGCPYQCTYCYNSSELEDIIASQRTRELFKILYPTKSNVSRKQRRLFPVNIRKVDDVIKEAREIVENWPTKVFYFQDDVHGLNTKWMEEFAPKLKEEVGLPYHAQMRWEMTRDKKRLDLLQEAGCFGLTLAIEAADPTIRKEVLGRNMPEEIMFNGMKEVRSRGFKVRTEQITGLPYGATSKQTPVNLDADLGLVELNVKLREETGGPDIAWASTLAPYAGTKLGIYCREHGHYKGNKKLLLANFLQFL